MKTKLLFLGFCIGLLSALKAQVYFDFIAVNNVSITPVTSNGYLGFYGSGSGGFYVPKNNGTSAAFATALWMGGLDAGGQLHLAAQTYAQNGNDFTYGPYPSSSASFSWNKVWKIRKTMIDSFKLNLYSTIPSQIATWPANGNTSLGQAAQLAPFKDLNNNGIYEPNLGEYPCIKGDEALYAIYNDDITHNESKGLPLGVEVHQMIYGFNQPNDSALWNTVFFNYRIINRSNNTYNPFYVSLWSDVDVGNYADDYVGTDVNRNAIFGYNGDNYDESTSGLPGYGNRIPVSGFCFLDFPLAPANDGVDNNRNCIIDEVNETVSMCNSMTYFNNIGSFSPVVTNPSITIQYWNYMNSKWKDTSDLKRGGLGYNSSSVSYKYIYPDSTDNQYGWGAGGNCLSPVTFTNSWDEETVGNNPGDRRIMGTIGPMTLPPNGEICFSFAYIFAQDSIIPDSIYPIRLFKHRVDQIQSFFTTNQLGGCGCYIFTSVPEFYNWVNIIYPNPANDVLHLNLHNDILLKKISITDVTGKIIELKPKNNLYDKELVIDISSLADGYYILNLENSFGEKVFHPIIIQH
jgi:hypothetical protein